MPIIVELNIDGILAIKEITKKLDSLIGRNGARYMNISLGMPGVKNRMKR